MATDNRRILSRHASLLTPTEVRTLVKVMDNCSESLWDGLMLCQILALYHVAQDAGYHDIEGWYSEDRAAAQAAYDSVRAYVGVNL